jgi:serine/threonine-protein kinase
VSDDSDERAQERVGSVLNEKWKLERLIGIGGMAAVYAGMHRNGARAAIKVLHPAYARRADVRDRFLREGYAANRVSHSGAVKVLDDDIIQGGPDDGGAFLVMELLEGRSIEDRLDQGPPISEAEVLAIMRAVLDVLEVAHKEGIIHRDLKPENLFLAQNPDDPAAPPRIKILDFGLARISDGGGQRTVVGLAIGTPSYMPPEQAAGRVLEIDGRSDLFALGASCFRVLAGRTVHPAEDAVAICGRMASEPAPKLRTVAPQVSASTAAVIDRALAFRPKDRWPDAASMRSAVDDAIGDLGGETIRIDSGAIDVSVHFEPRSLPPPRPEPASEPPSDEPEEPSRPPSSRPRKRRGSSFLVWLLICVLAVVAGKLVYDAYGKSLLAAAADAGVLPSAAPWSSAPDTDTLDASEADAAVVDAGTHPAHTHEHAEPTPSHRHAHKK